MLQITTLKGNHLNQKLKTLSLAYVIRKDQFLSKAASSEEMWGVRVLSFILFYLYVCMYVCSLGRCAKIVFACITNTLQRHFSVMLINN